MRYTVDQVIQAMETVQKIILDQEEAIKIAEELHELGVQANDAAMESYREIKDSPELSVDDKLKLDAGLAKFLSFLEAADTVAIKGLVN